MLFVPRLAPITGFLFKHTGAVAGVVFPGILAVVSGFFYVAAGFTLGTMPDDSPAFCAYLAVGASANLAALLLMLV